MTLRLYRIFFLKLLSQQLTIAWFVLSGLFWTTVYSLGSMQLFNKTSQSLELHRVQKDSGKESNPSIFEKYTLSIDIEIGLYILLLFEEIWLKAEEENSEKIRKPHHFPEKKSIISYLRSTPFILWRNMVKIAKI